MTDYYDKKGIKITLLEWINLFEDRIYSAIKQEEVSGLKVSTIWLGANHNWGEGRPLIFETMVFKNTDGQEIQERYSTEKEALEGHGEICNKIKKGDIK